MAISEETARDLFYGHEGYQNKFEFLNSETRGHSAYGYFVKCKSCFGTFKIWPYHLKGIQKYVMCPYCKTIAGDKPQRYKKQEQSKKDRRSVSDENYKKKFAELGLDKYFEYAGRVWERKNDKRFKCSCKYCGELFVSCNEVYKGRQINLHCPKCGQSSDGTFVAARRLEYLGFSDFYVSQSPTVRECAEKYGVSMSAINNFVKKHHITNGKDWLESGIQYGQTIRVGPVPRRKISGRLSARAWRHGTKVIDKGITLKAVYKKYDGYCCICGKQCRFDDKRWGSFGPDYPVRGHILASSKGGEVSWKNIWLLCGECNRTSGIDDEYIYLISGGWKWNESKKRYERG